MQHTEWQSHPLSAEIPSLTDLPSQIWRILDAMSPCFHRQSTSKFLLLGDAVEAHRLKANLEAPETRDAREMESIKEEVKVRDVKFKESRKPDLG